MYAVNLTFIFCYLCIYNTEWRQKYVTVHYQLLANGIGVLFAVFVPIISYRTRDVPSVRTWDCFWKIFQHYMRLIYNYFPEYHGIDKTVIFVLGGSLPEALAIVALLSLTCGLNVTLALKIIKKLWSSQQRNSTYQMQLRLTACLLLQVNVEQVFKNLCRHFHRSYCWHAPLVWPSFFGTACKGPSRLKLWERFLYCWSPWIHWSVLAIGGNVLSRLTQSAHWHSFNLIAGSSLKTNGWTLSNQSSAVNDQSKPFNTMKWVVLTRLRHWSKHAVRRKATRFRDMSKTKTKKFKLSRSTIDWRPEKDDQIVADLRLALVVAGHDRRLG